jgi:hypothetical protein
MKGGEQGAEENIWTKERQSDRSVEKTRNEKLHNLHSLLSIIRMIKSRRMRWAGHVARMGRKEKIHIGYWWESQKGRDH